MKLSKRDYAVFGIGALVGSVISGVVTYIFMSRRYEAAKKGQHAYLIHQNVELTEELAKERVKNDKLQKVNNGLMTIVDNISDDPESASDTGRDKGVMSRQQRDSIRQRLMKNFEGTTNYAGLYHEETDVPSDVDDIEEELAESEHPEDDISEEDEIVEEYHDPREEEHEGDMKPRLPVSSSDADVDEFFREHQKKKTRKPRIISAEEAANIPEYVDAKTLFFYATNEVVTDEDEEVIEDPELLIGDALTKYGFSDNDEKRIFVMNYELDTCYEVCKILGSYEVD